MEVLIAALVASGVLSLGAHFVRRRRRRRDGTDSGQPSTVRALEQLLPGDAVVHDGGDLLVAGVVRLSDGRLRWREARLLDGGMERWMVVLPDRVQFGAAIGPLPIIGQPPEQLDHGQRIYRLERTGQARAALNGDLGGAGEADSWRPAGEWEYWEYVSPRGERLWIRRASGELYCFAGVRVSRHLVQLLVGS